MFIKQIKPWVTLARLESDICKAFYSEVRMLQNWKQFPCEIEIMHIANERPMTKDKNQWFAYNNHLKAMGVLKGAPDYLIIAKGRFMFIEFKRSKSQKLSDQQVMFKEFCDRNEIPFLCTYTSLEAIKFIKDNLK